MDLTLNKHFEKISSNELEDINGGIAPLLVGAACAIAGGAGWALGEWVAEKF